jgi:hypothetical protein
MSSCVRSSSETELVGYFLDADTTSLRFARICAERHAQLRAAIATRC